MLALAWVLWSGSVLADHGAGITDLPVEAPQSAAGASSSADVSLNQDELTWTRLSSSTGHLPSPAASQQQTSSLILDVDRDGINDFVLTTRRTPGPSVLWYRRTSTGWERYVIENTVLNIEAGGAFHDIDNDGDLDIVFGGDGRSPQVWWWENPYPNYSPTVNWTRRIIKSSGCNKHHDMMFGDFDGNGVPELAFWNQTNRGQDNCPVADAGTIFLAEVPGDAATRTTEWPRAAIYKSGSNRDEGMAAADIDLDGLNDIIAGGRWFKFTGGTAFTPNLFERIDFARVAAADLIPGGRPEIVQVPGDATGKARLYQWNGTGYSGSDLLPDNITHGHSLSVGDVNADGRLDIFIAEMRFVNDTTQNQNARMLLLLGDGQGNFAPQTVATGHDNHESGLGDLDGDGDLDILSKPFAWETPRIDVWLNGPGGADPPCEPLGNWQTEFIDTARPWRAVFIDSADLDGDGDEDVISGAWWYRNPYIGGGNWTRIPIDSRLVGATSPVAGTFNQFAAAADFDGDNDIDLLGTQWAGGTAAAQLGNAFVWARNDGAGSFEINDTSAATPNGTFLQGATATSFQSGQLEVVLSWHNEALPIDALTIPTPATGAWSRRVISATSQGEDLSTGDIDRDNDKDLLLGTWWLQNDGGGTSWTPRVLFDTTLPPDRNRLADVNGDGRLDAVVGYESVNTVTRLAWYQSPADSIQPWAENIIANIVAPMSMDVADIDGDGDPDVVVGEHITDNPTLARVLLYENVNNGASWRSYLVATGQEHHDGTQFVDIDNDGDLDVISIGWTHGNVLLYRQMGCGAAATATPAPSPTPTSDAPSPTTEPPSPTPTATIEGPTETATVTTDAPTGTPTDTPVSPTATLTRTPTPTAESPTATTTPSTTPTIPPSPTSGGGPNRAYRVLITVGAGGYARNDSPAEVAVNFTQLLNAQSATGAFDPNSLLVVELGAADSVIDANVPFQFDRTANFNPNTNAAGTLVWLLKGVTPASATRRYHVYFDVAGKGFMAPVFTPLVVTTDNVSHKGYNSLRLVTSNAEYYYHKPGGGFATLLDINNNDWISWNTSAGAAGDFRGIPNLVHPNNGGYFHPGRDSATTTLLTTGPLKATFRSNANAGGWESVWEIYPAFARMTVTAAPSTAYWFQYEGTPGGALDLATDNLTRSDGSSIPASGNWTTDIPGEEWLYFSDAGTGRSLYLIHHQEDTLIDGYYQMDGLMTVFGFGRNSNNRLLTGTGRRFTMGLTDSTALSSVRSAVHNAYKPLNITVDSGQGAGTPNPTVTATTSATVTPTAASTVTPTTTRTPTPPSTPAQTSSVVFVSPAGTGTLSGKAFTGADVLSYNKSINSWDIFYDGSAAGTPKNLSAFAFRGNDLYLGFSSAQTISGLGSVAPQDLVRFTPARTGYNNTAGSFAWHFDGSDVGLSTSSEKIDALWIDAQGRLYLSTTASGSVPVNSANPSGATISFQDEDILRFTPSQLGATTAGTWALYWDATALPGMSAEDINGYWEDPATGHRYVTILGSFTIGAAAYGRQTGNGKTILRFAPSAAAPGGWAPVEKVTWLASGASFPSNIDEIEMALTAGPGSGTASPTPTPTAAATATATPTPFATVPASACTTPGAIGQWLWNRHEIDSNRPGMATFLFPFDINGNGRVDFVTGKYWYANPGTAGGNWARTQLPAPLEDVIAVYDFDGDSDLDLLGSAGPTEPSSQSVWWPLVWARNEGGGTFTVFQNLASAGVTMPVNDPVQGVAIARFSPGGPLEVAVTWDDTENPSRNPYGVQMFTVPSDPATQTWARRQLSTVSTGEQISAADVDRDGDFDLFMGAKWLRNEHPAGSWTPFTAFTITAAGQQASRHDLRDLDGDSDLDTVIGFSHNPDDRRIAWYEQPTDPTSTWGTHLIGMHTLGHAESMDVADLDGDGDVDVVVGEYRPNGTWSDELPASLWVYENLGGGAGWNRHLIYYGDSHYQSSRVTDVDGDGDLDIISKGLHHRRVFIYENLSGCQAPSP